MTGKRLPRRLPRPEELDQLRQLQERIGITRLARDLDMSFYTCRSLLAVERMTDRTLTHVRDRLPGLLERHLRDATIKRTDADPQASETLQVVDPVVRDRLVVLAPYVSQVRLAQALSVSPNTLRAVAAGYRPMRATTIRLLRTHLDELLRPPYQLLQEVLVPPGRVLLKSLHAGLTPPLPGLSVAATTELLSHIR